MDTYICTCGKEFSPIKIPWAACPSCKLIWVAVHTQSYATSWNCCSMKFLPTAVYVENSGEIPPETKLSILNKLGMDSRSIARRHYLTNDEVTELVINKILTKEKVST